MNPPTFPYQALIGTGGIGSGIFAALKGNQTLGREESRAVHFLDRRDYCKLHIISHYFKVLMGPDFPTILVGKVGDDPVGQRLLGEMQQTGLDIRYVEVAPGSETLFSVCFLYPDGSGGNLTSEDSACAHVEAANVMRSEPDFARYAGHGIALAAPEVPLPARYELLRLATRYGFWRAASFVSAEIQEALAAGLFDMLDLVALNVDEAAALSGLDAESTPAEAVVNAAVDRLSRAYPRLMLSLTAGKQGSWSWDGRSLRHLEAYPAQLVGSAGAGDAHLAGIMAGWAAGMPLTCAQELGGLAAALSIQSPHTIAPEVDRAALWQYVQARAVPVSQPVAYYLKK